MCKRSRCWRWRADPGGHVRQLRFNSPIGDGVTVYECTADQQVIDLVRGGQGVFGIAIGQVWTDVQATLTHLPTETPTPVGEPTGRAVSGLSGASGSAGPATGVPGADFGQSGLADLGREASTAELAQALDLAPERVLEVQRYAREPLSLHTPLGEDADSEFGDLIEDTEAIAPADVMSPSLLRAHFEAALAMLSEREAAVMRMRFGLTDGEPRTLEEIGRVQGVTRERIRQIESKALSKLRHPTRHNGLRDVL